MIFLVPPLAFGGQWSDWLYRACVLLIIACPCALVISTRVSIVAGLTAMARRGVLVKGGAHLESIARLRALAVDKTGTITEGKPSVQGVDAIAPHSSSDDDGDSEVPATVSWWTVATITVANGSDNLGVYIPVFAVQSPLSIAVISVMFLLLTFVWCGLAAGVVRHPRWGNSVQKFAERFGPYVLIGVGLWVLAEHPYIRRLVFG